MLGVIYHLLEYSGVLYYCLNSYEYVILIGIITTNKCCSKNCMKYYIRSDGERACSVEHTTRTVQVLLVLVRTSMYSTHYFHPESNCRKVTVSVV
jgi:hypothetical protein